MKEIEGKQQTFEKLWIDDVCLLDKFEKEISINRQFLSEYKTIISYMNFVARGYTLSDSKFREIKGNSPFLKQYEFKSKHLRIYAIKNDNGKIIVFGGYKKIQQTDIKRLNKIAAEYVFQKKQAHLKHWKIIYGKDRFTKKL